MLYVEGNVQEKGEIIKLLPEQLMMRANCIQFTRSIIDLDIQYSPTTRQIDASMPVVLIFECVVVKNRIKFFGYKNLQPFS